MARKLRHLLLLALPFTLALAGCGGDSDKPGGGGGDGGGNGGEGGAGGGGSSEEAVNDCTAADAEDDTGESKVTVEFGGDLGFAFSPACIRIKKGASVTFAGEFEFHPLTPGTVAEDGTPTEAKSSPMKLTDSGTEATFKFPDAGTFGYFCGVHGPVAGGMYGAVIVE